MSVLTITKHNVIKKFSHKSSTLRVTKNNIRHLVGKHDFVFVIIGTVNVNHLLDPDGNILLDQDGNPLLAGDGTS